MREVAVDCSALAFASFKVVMKSPQGEGLSLKLGKR
jgi:hypothetical protein